MAHTNGSVAKPEWWWGYRHGTPQTKSKKNSRVLQVHKGSNLTPD